MDTKLNALQQLEQEQIEKWKELEEHNQKMTSDIEMRRRRLTGHKRRHKIMQHSLSQIDIELEEQKMMRDQICNGIGNFFQCLLHYIYIYT